MQFDEMGNGSIRREIIRKAEKDHDQKRTGQSLRTRLSGLYKEAEVTAVEGIGCFCCKK